MQGHKVTEMPNNKTIMYDRTKLTCIVTEGYDSCLLVDDGNFKFLNINDSQLDKEAEIKKIIKHTPVDLIVFSFTMQIGQAMKVMKKYQSSKKKCC